MSFQSQTFIWEQILLVVGFSTVCFVILLAPIYYVLRWLDTRDKTGPRCRKCNYDLRATSGEACPECGRDLLRKGVWPVGKPNRGPLILALMFWSWLVLTIVLSVATFYSEYRYQIFCKYEGVRELLILEDSISGKDISIYIRGYGTSRNWLSVKEKTTLPLEQLCIEVYNANDYTSTIATIDTTSLGLTTPLDDTRASYQAMSHHGDVAPHENSTTLEYMLKPLHKSGSGVVVDSDLEQDIAQVIELTEFIATTINAIHSEDIITQEVFDQMKEQSSEPLRFTSAYSLDEFDIYNEPFYEWGYAITPATGFLIWMLGVPIIRASVYKRMAVSGVPANPKLPN